MKRRSHRVIRVAALFVALVTSIVTTIHAQTPRGRVTGRVVDASSGQSIAHAQIEIIGSTLGGATDLDGRYTILGVTPGRYSIRARRIGFQLKQFDSVTVTPSEATVVNFTIGAVTTTLQTQVVQATRLDQAASEASLLSMQQRAAAASDGISAEQIRRTPDSNAGEAATRVSGISIVDNKFVIARGLSERYSTTLVNGAEVASPEPAKKIVPLDIFPASLLESIVVTKSATADKPGDFSGGAVEVRTKEFPDNSVFQFSISQSFNSQATFKAAPFPQQHGMDFLGFGSSRRSSPPIPASLADTFAVERYAEGIRHDWAPASLRALPNLGLSLSIGGQKPSDRIAIGYIASLTYSKGSERQENRFFQFFSSPEAGANRGFVYQDNRTVVDWGGVGNLSFRIGSSSKLSWKNLYTRNAEELYSTSEGFNVDRNGDVRGYQFQYIERDLLQTQVTGEHLLNFLNASRFEWKATLSRSGRDEPDNRQVEYLRSTGQDQFALGTNSDVQSRTLTDRQTSVQGDWQLPIHFLWHDYTFKVGALARLKKRAFDANLVSFNPRRSGLPADLVYLPPERLFTPENIGSYLGLTFPGNVAQPYDADEKVNALYAMVDTDILPHVRLVAGARSEDWSIDLFDGGRDRFAVDTSKHATLRRNRDLLWSANATVALSDRMNLRLAAFTSVARPDTRELSLDEYTDIIGNCSTIGNPNLQRSTVINGDARWEFYPRPGEVISVSGFYKDFTAPIIRVVMGRNGCTYSYDNATSARNFGAEVDIRQNLTYLPGLLSKLGVGLNYTYVESRVTISPQFGVYDPNLALEGQSPYVANASLTYAGERGLSVALLYNVFGDRIVRYGFRSSGGADAAQGPNIVERGRGTFDAKLQRPVGAGFTFSVAAKNLTDAPVKLTQKIKTGLVATGSSKPGVTLQVGVSHAR
jgi:hypothetical protein